MKYKKICIISEYAFPYIQNANRASGGAELQMLLLARYLVKYNYEVHFIVFDNSESPYIKLGDIHVHIPYNNQKSGFKHFNPLNIFKLFKLFKKIDADIFIQSSSSPITGIIALYKKIKNKKFVFISSSDANVSSTLLINNLKEIIRFPYMWGVKNSNCVVCQTKHQKKLLKKSISRNGTIIKTIIPLESSSNLNKGNNTIIWIGRIFKYKSPELYLELAKSLSQYNFKMIGGPTKEKDEFYNKIKNFASKIKNLEFLGFVPHSEISNHYSEADIFISTSSSEGFPNTFLEAWSNSTPIVSINFDPDNIIKEQKLGLYCNNFDDLVKNTIELMENHALRAQMGENALKYVKKNHDPQKIVEQYIKLFESL